MRRSPRSASMPLIRRPVASRSVCGSSPVVPTRSSASARPASMPRPRRLKCGQARSRTRAPTSSMARRSSSRVSRSGAIPSGWCGAWMVGKHELRLWLIMRGDGSSKGVFRDSGSGHGRRGAQHCPADGGAYVDHAAVAVVVIGNRKEVPAGPDKHRPFFSLGQAITDVLADHPGIE